MARAGFTAIHSGRITFGKDGRWYCDGEEIANRAICRLYSRAMQVRDDGRGRLELGEDRADVDIEDTPWVVTRVDGDPASGFVVTLNDDSREPLALDTLRIGPGDVLYCRVKGGRHDARLLRPPYYELTRHAARDGAGRVVLAAGGHTVVLAAEDA
jgi:hypothetical protein